MITTYNVVSCVDTVWNEPIYQWDRIKSPEMDSNIYG